MKQLFYVICFTCMSFAAISQSSSIKGSIRDTLDKKNLPHAVISLLRSSDSLLVKYSRSDNQGNFNISNIASGEYVLLITYPKFADYGDKITLVPSQVLDIGAVPLTQKSVLLQEVVIRNNRAIRIMGDTTEFTADSFKVREGATVEDLLKQIPGMQVNSKGEITSQGKRVDKVLVDGEEFFGEDPTIATQNIGAKAVDKVQVFDTKTEQDQLKGIGASGDGKTINIKLKESAKKGYFGNLVGSTDFKKMLNAKMMYNIFQGNKKFSVYGTRSNFNTGELGWEERNKLGIEDDYEYDEINGYYYSYGDQDNDFNDYNLKGIPTAATVGALFGNKWNEDKNKLNLSYLYNRLGTTNTSRSISQTLLKDTSFFSNSIARSKALSQRHVLNAKYEWKIDSFASIKYTAVGTYKMKDSYTDTHTETLSEDKELVNTNDRINDIKSTKKQLDNVLTYKQLFRKKDRQLLTTLRLGLLEDDQEGNLIATARFYKNGMLDSTALTDQLKINAGNSTTLGARITYSEPLNAQWNIVTEYSLNSNNSISHRNSYDKVASVYSKRNVEFSNNFDLDALSNSGTVTARYVGKKLRTAFGAGLSAIRLNLNNLDLAKKTTYNFTGFTPQAQVAYRFKPQTGVSISYRGNTVQPSITQLQPLRNNNDNLVIYEGNPDLKVGFRHSLNLSFNDYKVLKGRYIYGNGGISFTNNAIVNQGTFDLITGKTTYKPVNVKGNNNWNFYAGWFSGEGDKKLIHEIQPSANGGRSVNFWNNSQNINTYTTFSLSYGIRYSIVDKYNFNIRPRISRNISKSSLTPATNNNYWTYGGQANGYIKLPLNLDLSSDIDLNLQEKTNAFPDGTTIIVWNAELHRKFLKDKVLDIGIIAHDLLNQNLGFNRTINSNYISEERFDRIARYFLFRVSWTFNKMPGKTN